MSEIRGEEVHGEISSADASGGVDVALYSAGGRARTLLSTETLVVTDILLAWVAGGSVALVVNTDAAGLRLFKGTVGANGGVHIDLRCPHYCPQGILPHLVAAAGQIDVQIHGFILSV